MSETSRSCARCRRVAVVARGNAAYCLDCNRILDWSQVITIVQNAAEPNSAGLPEAAPVAVVQSNGVSREPVYTGGGSDHAEADPFSQKLI